MDEKAPAPDDGAAGMSIIAARRTRRGLRARCRARTLRDAYQRIVAPARNTARGALAFRRAWNPTSRSSHSLTL